MAEASVVAGMDWVCGGQVDVVDVLFWVLWLFVSALLMVSRHGGFLQPWL